MLRIVEYYVNSLIWLFAEIDECDSSPCLNGQCEDQVNGYDCICQPGWTGTLCDVGLGTLRSPLNIELIQ